MGPPAMGPSASMPSASKRVVGPTAEARLGGLYSAGKTLPLHWCPTTFVAKTLLLPCVPTAFVAETVPFLAVLQVHSEKKAEVTRMPALFIFFDAAAVLCVILVSKIAPNIYVSKYTFSALTCIITYHRTRDRSSGRVGVFGSTFRPKPGRLECLRKTQDNIMLNNTLSQLSRG